MPDQLSIVKSEPLTIVASQPDTGPHMGALEKFITQLGQAVGPMPTGGDLPFQNAVGPKARKALTSPLIHPTGIDAVDSLTSPVNLALAAISGGKPAVSAAYQRVSQLLSHADPELATEIVGLMKPKAVHGLNILQKLGEMMKSPPEAAAPAPEATAAPAAPPEAAPSAPSGKSPQQILNEEAIARRRAAYQAATSPGAASAAPPTAAAALGAPPSPAPAPAAAPPSPPAPPVRPKLSADQAQAYFRLRAMGKTDAEAKAAMEALAQLKQSQAFGHLPDNFEMAQDMTKRAEGGQKSLTGVYRRPVPTPPE